MTEGYVYRPADFRRVFVENQSDLPALLAELSQAEALGVDLEMGQRVERHPGGLQEWVNILALIQISSTTLSVVIDPLRCGDLSSLRPLMASDSRKVFLGGGQDVALLASSGIPARNVVDVGEVGYALFGRREDGMAALAHRIFGISLDKTVRRADWLARPLNPVLVTYAHRDAELTLLIYHWLRDHFPETVQLHERVELEPELPSTTPAWLRDAVNRPSADAYLAVMEHEIDPKRDAGRLSSEIAAALAGPPAPRQVNRLIRIATDLGLSPLLPDLRRLATSQSSLIRASVARALGQLGEPADVEILETMKSDSVPDVARSAETALKLLKKPRPAPQAEESEEEAPSLGDDALAALEKLRQQLESGG